MESTAALIGGRMTQGDALLARPYHYPIPEACPRCGHQWKHGVKWYVWLYHDPEAHAACGWCNYRFTTEPIMQKSSYWTKVAII